MLVKWIFIFVFDALDLKIIPYLSMKKSKVESHSWLAVGTVEDLGFHMCRWARQMKGGAHLLSLRRLNLPQLWRESGTHLLLGEQREFSAHPIEGDFDPGTFRTTSERANH